MNLKSAARRLGVHYQTAYRWVRSGQLLAVKVGAGYEISEAALHRFEVQRAAIARLPRETASLPVADGNTASHASALHMLDRMADAVTVDARAVVDRATRVVADVLGDSTVVYARDARGHVAVVEVAHPDPACEVVAATLVRDPRTINHFALDALRSGEAVFLPQVAQRDLRRCLHPELHQFLTSVGCYSATCVPIGVDRAVLVTRDGPGRPYTRDDLRFLEAVAERVNFALRRAERCEQAWEMRRSVAYALAPAVRSSNAAGEYSFDQLDEMLQAAVMFDPQTVVALLDLDLRHLACTKAYALLLGDEPSRVVDLPLTSLVANPAEVDGALGAIIQGEIDFASIEVERAADRSEVSMHLAMLRDRDATPWALVTVAHAAPGSN